MVELSKEGLKDKLISSDYYREQEDDSAQANLSTDQTSQMTEQTDDEQTPRERALARLFELSGGFGKFSYLIMFANQCVVSSFNFILYGLGFLVQKPDYTCTFADPASVKDPFSVCTAENICDGHPQILSWGIDWDSNNSLQNWQQKLNLMCRPEWEAGSLGSVYFIACVTTLFWLPRLGDVYG